MVQGIGASVGRQYGTSATIKALQEVAGTFSRNLPAVQIGIGDISLSAGGNMAPHQSHKEGRDVDIRPLRKDKTQAPVTVTDPQCDRDLTRLLAESLRAHRNVKRILFNDSAIGGVTAYPGHHNHLHVCMKEGHAGHPHSPT